MFVFLNSINNLQTYRHHVYEKHGGPKSIELKEVGPRFEMRPYQVFRLLLPKLSQLI
jgi:hypothetical protein